MEKIVTLPFRISSMMVYSGLHMYPIMGEEKILPSKGLYLHWETPKYGIIYNEPNEYIYFN